MMHNSDIFRVILQVNSAFYSPPIYEQYLWKLCEMEKEFFPWCQILMIRQVSSQVHFTHLNLLAYQEYSDYYFMLCINL